MAHEGPMSTDKSPSVIVLAGPNGAGKSTTAPSLLRGTLGVGEFVNADTIAQGLAAFDPDRAAIPAGRVMLARLKDLAEQRESFAFESTLASRTFAPWLRSLIDHGYRFHLIFLWLPSADFAVDRVADRVNLGGHAVSETTIRRRYSVGLRNFFDLYRPIATTWRIYDNSQPTGMSLIAAGNRAIIEEMRNPELWEGILEAYGSGH
jgi:predicted ABC-type ATPase